MSGSPDLKVAFVPLSDAAVVIVAWARGFFRAEGLAVELSREVSWATVRDKLQVGAVDGAHLLAPIALASTAGQDGAATPMIAPLALNQGGAALTLAARLAAIVGPGSGAEGLARVIERRREEGASQLTFAVVFPLSTHNYLLRDWLAAAGIRPDEDLRLTVAPPSRMADLLADGVIEGFCAGEPWNAVAVAKGVGEVMMRSSRARPTASDKVFAVREAAAEAQPERLQAALRALLRAGDWADAPENRAELVSLLAEPGHVGADPSVIRAGLSDIRFSTDGASLPDPLQARWLLSQMVRWNHIPATSDTDAIAARVYRQDLFAQALGALGA